MINIKLSHWQVYIISMVGVMIGFTLLTARDSELYTITEWTGLGLFVGFLIVQVFVVAIMSDIVEKWKRKEKENA